MSGICDVCGLPKEICVCEDIAREQQKITITVDKRRYGKMMTIVYGIDSHDLDIDSLITQLKSKLSNTMSSEAYRKSPPLRVLFAYEGITHQTIQKHIENSPTFFSLERE